MSSSSNQSKTLLLITRLLMLILFSPTVFAGARENQIIDKAIEAYGGDALLKLQSLEFSDNINRYSKWQSGHSLQGPMISYLDKLRIELAIDLVNEQKVFKRATTRLVGNHGTQKPTVTHRIFADGQGYTVDHALQLFQSTKYIHYDNTDLGISLWLDPLIIRRLHKDRKNTQWTDVAYIKGEAHDVLTVKAGSNDEYIVYLNQQRGYLSRLLRKRGQQTTSYDFFEHHKTQGILWAKQLFVGDSNGPVYQTESRNLRFNSVDEEQFKVPMHYKPKPKTQAVDVSRLTLRQLAKDVYFVGQDWAYTLFIDAGDYYISAGAWQMDTQSRNWEKGLALLKQKTGRDKPVKQHLVTHHHTDHMMELSDIVKQGAQLVIHPSDISSVQAHLTQPLSAERFLVTSDGSSLLEGKVMIFDVPNSHANHNLVIYLPEHKILFTEDMFGSSLQTAFDSPSRWPDIDAYHRLEVLEDRINQLGLDVEHYVSSHHARILSRADIQEALKVSRPSRETLLRRLFSDLAG
ncbi:MBL fold metallo-hydrolase [Pleionea sp. CnH1-48]|uniref:MBL fold metallo-hydrolase n=1 Tax=Pleionea sp. CnH1-48 TaxID=2954494 RepID=UPI002097B268|nr:MBL fold metallo-hydrolase [Pleionea sp. CnH1-48]MCO7224390.1 MBL fold metallo-hydrolase [Pleionea sp. CnH1-48]